jgi:hypothetical protein
MVGQHVVLPDGLSISRVHQDPLGEPPDVVAGFKRMLCTNSLPQVCALRRLANGLGSQPLRMGSHVVVHVSSHKEDDVCQTQRCKLKTS